MNQSDINEFIRAFEEKCLCGALLGEKHLNCPYSYYGNNKKEIDKWIAERKKLMKEKTSRIEMKPNSGLPWAG